MSTHNILNRTLLTAFVLSITGIASAHNFPKPITQSQLRAEREAACRATALRTNPTAKRAFTRFGPPAEVTTGASYRVAGAYRFGGKSGAPVVACTRPSRGMVACR